MEPLTISSREIKQTIATNQVAQLQLKDGTILRIAPKTGQSNQKNLNYNKLSSQSTQYAQLNSNDNENHNHHQDGIGAFGQHFKTEYSQMCSDCIDGGVVKQRQNYVLYVSKNITEGNISKKHNKACSNQMKQQVIAKKNIKIVPHQKKLIPKKGGINGQKIISQGYVECNDIPIIKPKIQLRNNYQMSYGKQICPDCCKGEKVCPDCCKSQKGQVIQQKYGVENTCPECDNEDEDNINGEKITTTVKVLVPES